MTMTWMSEGEKGLRMRIVMAGRRLRRQIIATDSRCSDLVVRHSFTPLSAAARVH